ncbi:MAG: tRNA (5-methylaminomethyl-2-thiouridine)(34)-methyltransferase MnmD [Bacteroidota bacterium]
MSKSSIFETQDGSHSIFSEEFGVSYHSKYGAVQETRHVFIDAALRFKAVVQKDISILEIGLGTGLNALMTYLEAKKRNLHISYVAYEAFPISLEAAQQLNFNKILQVEPEDTFVLQQLHDSDWEKATAIDENFNFLKHQQTFDQITYQDRFDIIYFDAFAPNSQPELWELPIMEKMFAALKKTGILVTYCAKGEVKRTMKKAGFTVERLKGPPGKREMTRAVKLVS